MKELSGLTCTDFVQTVVFNLYEIPLLVASEEDRLGFGEVQYKEIGVLGFRRRLFRYFRQHRFLRRFTALAP